MQCTAQAILRVIVAAAILTTSVPSFGAEPRRLQISNSVIERTTAGAAVDVLVLLDDSSEQAAMASTLAVPERPHQLRGAEYGRYISEKARLLRGLKRGVLSDVTNRDIEFLTDYDVVPVMHMRLRNASALERLKAHSKVLSIDEIRVTRPMLTQSLSLINQPSALVSGYMGTNTTVCVLDTGVDYTRVAFGACASPGNPAGCKVAAAVDIAPNDGQLDDPASMHGTNVAGIVLGVAPGARVAALDVFNGSGATSNDILSGINWCIANRATYNIVAINMSLGGARYYSALSPTDSVGVALQNARELGILTVVASGNDRYTDSMAWPAAYSNVVSVGAVYDASMGLISYSSCTDTSEIDKVTCFSNSASFLTLLAPGASINAADISMSGTSQATPHVAGAVAVLASAYPAETSTARVTRLQQGTNVTDSRNGITKPRLDLAAALALPAPPPEPEPQPGTAGCNTTECDESYGGWRIRYGLR